MNPVKNKGSFIYRFALSYLVLPMLPVTLILMILLLISLIVRGFKEEHVLSLVITFILLNVIWFLLLLIFGAIIKKLFYYIRKGDKIIIASFPIGKEKEINYDEIKSITTNKRLFVYKLKIKANKNAVLLFAKKEDLDTFLDESNLSNYITK